MTILYLIRHAEATGNINKIFQGSIDSDLTPKGYNQIDLLKERFKDIEVDLIISSPLKRAFLTAQAVDFYHNLSVIPKVELSEINAGVFEGNHYDDLPKLYPKEFDLWQNSPHEFFIKDGETMIEVYDRITSAINEIVFNNKDKSIVVVSHACALKNYLCHVLDIPHSEILSAPWLYNTAVTKICFDDDFKANIEYVNDFSHLDKENLPINFDSKLVK